jgi:hypothetical protein
VAAAFAWNSALRSETVESMRLTVALAFPL